MTTNNGGENSLSRSELVARIKDVLIRGKKNRESYRSQNIRLGLTTDQSKYIRGIGSAGVGDDVLISVYNKIQEEGANEPILPAKRSLYGFDSYKAPPRRSPAYIAAHCGVYLGIGVSTLSQGMFFITINEITPSENGLHIVQKAFDKWESADEPQHHYEGHGYFVGQQIYMVLEHAHLHDEIMCVVVNQPDIPPPSRLFGVYVGRGGTDGQSSHPAAAQIAFLRLHDVKPGRYVDMKAVNPRLAGADRIIKERWIDEQSLRKLSLPEDTIKHLIGNNGIAFGDYALRPAGAFGKKANSAL